MPFIECRHIFAGGRKCESPTLRGELYCFYHARLHTRGRAAGLSPAPHLSPGLLEDADSVQLALSEVLGGIASGTLDPRRAGLLLYGLQVAAANVKHLRGRRDIFSVQEVTLHDDGTPLGPAIASTSLDPEDDNVSCDGCIDDCNDDCNCDCHDDEPEGILDLVREGAALLDRN